MVLKEGRFGPYVTDGTTNASLRRGDTVEAIDIARASELLAERRAAGPSTRKKKAAGSKKAPAKKASAAKKAAGSKKAPAKKASAAKKSVAGSKKAAAKKTSAATETHPADPF